MADTPANDTAFGRPGHSRGDCAGYPQPRLLGLPECGTHAITAVAMGGYGTAVPMLASELIDQGAWARGGCCWPAASDVPLRRITVQARSADLVVPLATLLPGLVGPRGEGGAGIEISADLVQAQQVVRGDLSSYSRAIVLSTLAAGTAADGRRALRVP